MEVFGGLFVLFKWWKKRATFSDSMEGLEPEGYKRVLANFTEELKTKKWTQLWSAAVNIF